jgi:transposase
LHISWDEPGCQTTLFVGIDIAKASASVAWMTAERTLSRAMMIEQTPHGFRSLQQRLLATGYDSRAILVVMEATGSYWMNLALSLTRADFQVSVINPAQAHHFAKSLLKRAKTDAIDAQTLAQLAALLQPAVWNPLRRCSPNSINGSSNGRACWGCVNRFAANCMLSRTVPR